MQWCSCFKRVHLRCLPLFFSRFIILGSTHSWRFHTYQLCVFSSGCSSLYTFTVRTCLSGPLSANAALHPYPRLQTSYLLPPNLYFPLCTLPTPSCFSLFYNNSCLGDFQLPLPHMGLKRYFRPPATHLFSSTATGPDKVAYAMLKRLSRSGMDFLLYIFNLA